MFGGPQSFLQRLKALCLLMKPWNSFARREGGDQPPTLQLSTVMRQHLGGTTDGGEMDRMQGEDAQEQ